MESLDSLYSLKSETIYKMTIARGTIIGGKLKYSNQTDWDKRNLQLAKEFTQSHEGSVIYISLQSSDEYEVSKNLPLYLEKIILPQLFSKMKDEYSLLNVSECEATLSALFGQSKKIKNDGKTEFIIHKRIKDMNLLEQTNFIAKVANFAVSKYQLVFPNANEIDSGKL